MSYSVEIRPATLADADALFPRLRPADVAEVEASCGDVLAALRQAVEISLDPQAVVWRGRVSMLFGTAAPDPFGDVGVLWALGARETGRLLVTHRSKVEGYIGKVLETFPLLVNQVDARNGAAIRWLRSLGAVIHPAKPAGVAGLPFHRFEVRHV